MKSGRSRLYVYVARWWDSKIKGIERAVRWEGHYGMSIYIADCTGK